MQIHVATGTGVGPTPLSAFDAALIAAGLENYNLIYLSSVIPPGSRIIRGKFFTPPDEFGHRLYVVMSRSDEHEKGHVACAGLGWTQDEATGRGLFVELHGPSREQVQGDIRITLESMKANRAMSFGHIESEMATIECLDRPVCAVAVAVYQSVGWKA